MASIISSIGCTRAYSEEEKKSLIPSGVPLWDGNKGFVENIVRYNIDDQLRCILDQAIALAYYISFYGMRCHDLVNEFINDFLTYTNGQFMIKAKRELAQTARMPILQEVEALAYFIKNGIWKRNVNVSLIKEYMDAAPYEATPSAWYKCCYEGKRCYDYIPFLMWKNKGVSNKKEDTADVKLGITSFHLHSNGNLLVLAAHSYSIGTSFSSELASDYKSQVAILDYLSHFNLSNITFEGVVGAIGEMCMHLDVRRSGTNSTQRLAACIRSNLMRCGCINGSTLSLMSDTERYKSNLFSEVTRFLEFAHKTYGTEVKDRNVLGELLYCIADTKERKDSANYIREQGGSASADDLTAYNKTLGSLEALQFISQSTTLLSAQSQVTAADANSEGEANKNTKPESPKTDQKDQAEAEEDDRDDEAKEDDSSEDEDPNDSKDDTTAGKDDLKLDDDQKGGEGETDASGEGSDTKDVDMPSEDEPEPQPNTSDTDGVKFEVVNPEGETTDSVMFREEVNTFISNILANPPDDISPQNLATLSALQRYWLYSLSIETIMGIVGSCTKQLPDSLTKLNTQCGVTNNE